MAGRALPRRTVVTLGLLQTTCGALTVASLVALGQAPSAIAAHDGAAPLARSYAAIPTEWDRGGPLAIPTIGVVPPGLEDWYDPNAPRPFPASTAVRSTLTVSTPATRSPVRSVQEPDPAPRLTAVDESTDPTPTESAQPTTSAADAVPPGTTAQETTQGSTTPSTTSPTTSTPPATTSATTTGPTTTGPTTTGPTTTEPPPPTDAPAPPPPPPETNERGNAVLPLGEELTVLDGETGALVLAVAVDSVSAEVTCTSPDATPPAGHLIAVQVRATTGSDLSAVGGEPAVRAADFSFLGPDGATLTAAGTPSAESCMPDTAAFPAGPLGADQEFAGVVVLDVPTIAGTLVFAPEFLTVGGEWTY